MHLSGSHKPGRLPKRFPVGTTYVVEGSGGMDGHLQVFSRYVVLPGGQRINLAGECGTDLGGSASPRARRQSGHRTESQARTRGKRRSSRTKKILAAAGTSRRARR
jgi:hypothetical protein